MTSLSSQTREAATGASKANSDQPKSTKTGAHHSNLQELGKTVELFGYLGTLIFQETKSQIKNTKKYQDGRKK